MLWPPSFSQEATAVEAGWSDGLPAGKDPVSTAGSRVTGRMCRITRVGA